MTKEKAKIIKDRYKNWIGKEVKHINPEQFLILESITLDLLKGSSDKYQVVFTLKDCFKAVLRRGTDFENIVTSKEVNHFYFEPNFVISK